MNTNMVCPSCGRRVELQEDGTCPFCKEAVFRFHEPPAIVVTPANEYAPSDDPLAFLASEGRASASTQLAKSDWRWNAVIAGDRPATPMPLSRSQALVLFVAGLICTGIVVGEFLIGWVVIRLTVWLVLFAPVLSYWGLVGLLMPRSYVGSPVHDRLNNAGVVVILLALIGGCIWYVITLLT